MKRSLLRRFWPIVATAATLVALAVVSAMLFETRGGADAGILSPHNLAAAATLDGSVANGPAAGGVLDQQGAERGFLGVSVSEAAGKVKVTSVFAGGPSDKAGVKTDDVIASVDSAAVASFAGLKQALASKKPGDSVTLLIDRGGAKQDIKVTLGDAAAAGIRRPVAGTGGIGLPGLPALGPLLGGAFDTFISNDAKTKDSNGQVHTDHTAGGVVKSVSANQVAVTLNGGGDQNFTLDSNTKILKGLPKASGQGGNSLAKDDMVLVNTRDGSSTPTWVLVVNPNGPGGIFRGQKGGGGIGIRSGQIHIQLPGGQDITLPLPLDGTTPAAPAPPSGRPNTPSFRGGGSRGSSNGLTY